MSTLADLFEKNNITNLHGMQVVDVAPDELLNAIAIIKDKMTMDSLMDVCCVDYPWRPERFDVIYNLISLRRNVRAFVRTKTNGSLPSMHCYFASAIWYEREIYDMYGIKFSDLPDHRRILMDEDFDGYPLRKDFPLTGYVEVRYDIEKREVAEFPVNLEQDYRVFDFNGPWDGPKKEMK